MGRWLLEDPRLPLVSFTGSIPTGRRVAQTVAGRLGRTLLELGGNNAIIISQNANLDLAMRGILFGAVGTAGQRCTSTRRLIVHESVVDALSERLVKAYSQVRIGDPLAAGTLMGPLATTRAVEAMQAADAPRRGRRRRGADRRQGAAGPRPAVCRADDHPHAGADRDRQGRDLRPDPLHPRATTPSRRRSRCTTACTQGLSSAIFTDSLREAETFLSAGGSDCGIANVNIGTSGAEIGGAFGGEKDTGGGRESGSDAWKSYMRRQTNTINWSKELPLAQGIEFGG